MSAISRNESEFVSKDKVITFTLLVATLICFYLSYRIIYPFLPALAWALGLAIGLHPIHDRFAKKIRNKNIAAGLAVVTVAVVIVGPAYFVGERLITEAMASISKINELITSGQWRNIINQHPLLANAANWLNGHVDLSGDIGSITGPISSRLSSVLVNSVMIILQLFITLFILFFFFRDRKQLVAKICSLLPLKANEAKAVISKVHDTILATLYGTIAVAMIQGLLGGFIFWVLGLPSPLVWGLIMGLLSIVPVLGTFVIWSPTALYLALQGSYGKAIFLVVWGVCVIGSIDNLLYPVLVGKRLRLGTLPVFISMIGGLSFFGSAGIIVGPVIFVLTSALIDIWRRRTDSETETVDKKLAA